MWRSAIVLLGLGGAVCGLYLGKTMDAAAIPLEVHTELSVEPSHLRLSASDGKLQTRNIRVINQTGRRYSLRSIDTTCGCSIPKMPEDTTIPIGGTLAVPIEVHVGQHKSKQATITVTDDLGKRYRIGISMEPIPVTPPHLVNAPSKLRTSGIAAGDRGDCEFTLQTLERVGTAHWIEGFSSANEHASASIVSVTEEELERGLVGRRYHCKFSSIVPADQSAVASGYVSVVVTAQQAGSAPSAIPYSISRIETLRAVPAEILLKPEGQWAGKILLLQYKRQDFTVLSVSANQPWLEGACLKNAFGKAIIEVRAKSSEATGTGHLKVQHRYNIGAIQFTNKAHSITTLLARRRFSKG